MAIAGLSLAALRSTVPTQAKAASTSATKATTPNALSRDVTQLQKDLDALKKELDAGAAAKTAHAQKAQAAEKAQRVDKVQKASPKDIDKLLHKIEQNVTRMLQKLQATTPLQVPNSGATPSASPTIPSVASNKTATPASRGLA